MMFFHFNLKMQRYYENEYEKRIHKQQILDANKSHHFMPQGHIVPPDRYQKAYAQKGTRTTIKFLKLFFHLLVFFFLSFLQIIAKDLFY